MKPEITNRIVFISIAIILVGLYFLSKDGEKQCKVMLTDIMQTGEFAIGAVRVSRTAKSKFLPYSFYVGSKRIPVTWHQSSNKYLLGRTYTYLWIFDRDDAGDFLVIYDPADPKGNSLVRLDCPIKDSSDFRRYVKTITEMREKGEATIGTLIPGGIPE